MPPQLKVLIPAFAIVIFIFLVIRHFLIPDSWGEYGFYRGDALTEISNIEPGTASKSDCIDCHPDIYEVLQSDMHAGLSCLICHGPGLEHVNSPEADNILKLGKREDCGRCHNINPARSPEVITQVNIHEHNIERNDCIECHNPHEVWNLKE